MVGILSLFFLSVYILCELFKYRKIESLKKHIRSKKKLYDVPICYIKFPAVVISLSLFVAYYFSKEAIVERSGGVLGLVPVFILYLLFIAVSFIDIKRIRNHWNEELIAGESPLKEEL